LEGSTARGATTDKLKKATKTVSQQAELIGEEWAHIEKGIRERGDEQ
jgi:hypothetical protein